MHCPFCRSTDTRVLDSRVSDDGASIRRRRVCSACERRFSTLEQTQLMVAKRSGTTEPFTRDKAVAGVRKACKGRPVSEDDLARLGQSVEDALRAEGWAEVPANEIGLAILGPLRSLDEVAWLRFASVYRAFTSTADFETAIAELRADHDPSVVKDAPASSPAEDARSSSVVEEARQRRLETPEAHTTTPTTTPAPPPQPEPISAG